MEIRTLLRLRQPHILRFIYVAQHAPIHLEGLLSVYLLLLPAHTQLGELLPLTKVVRRRTLIKNVLVMIVLHMLRVFGQVIVIF